MPQHWDNPLNVVFRADASRELGSGHIMRCLILAEKLRRIGAKVSFICRADEGNLCDFIWTKGFIVTTIGRYTPFSKNIDKQETIKVLQMIGQVDWLIVDHYQLDKAWEQSMRHYVKKIMVIDDLAKNKHDCDILLNQNFGVERYAYSALIPENCQLLLGTSFALLKDTFKKCQKTVPPSFKEIRNVHLFFGGMDVNNYTHIFSELLLKHFPHLQLKIIVGKYFSYVETIKQLKERYKDRVEWKQDVPDMAKIMAECEVAIGAPGITTWERACIGLPSAYLTTTDNQIEIVENLEKKGLCVYLGKAGAIDASEFLSKFSSFINNKKQLEELYKTSVENIDGYGVERVVSRLSRKE